MQSLQVSFIPSIPLISHNYGFTPFMQITLPIHNPSLLWQDFKIQMIYTIALIPINFFHPINLA